jgi:hypothetical protein
LESEVSSEEKITRDKARIKIFLRCYEIKKKNLCETEISQNNAKDYPHIKM